MTLVGHFFPKNESFSYEALRAAGYAGASSADLAEVITICSRIPSGNETAWLREWKIAADRTVVNAKKSIVSGNRQGAREAYLRASNYYRTAEFFRRKDPANDEVSNSLWELSVQTFHKAADLMSHSTEKIHIPYQGTTLPGLLIRPDRSDKPRPTIIVNGGYDSTKEETSHTTAVAALEQGFNVIAFEGPGQGEALRKQQMHFRPDWEKVITPVVDYALAQPFVDSKRLVIMGISMGGYLVARAAAFEHRAAAIILNDGVFDFGWAFRNETPALAKLLIKHGWDKTINFGIRAQMLWDTGLKWGLQNGMWAFGLTSAVDVLRVADEYTLEGVVQDIKTPTLVLDAPDDHFMNGQPKILFDRLICEKTFVEMTREDGSSAHCHMGSGARLNQVIFDYLLPLLEM